MSLRVFIDMDGVLADFNTGAYRAHGRPDPYQDLSNLGVWSLEKIWGISPREFWDPINAWGEDFWTGLDVLPGAQELVGMLSTQLYSTGTIAVLTSPSMHPGCVTGKRKWLTERFPKIGKNVVYTGAKHLLAGPNCLLIDDNESNVNEFRYAGGEAILYPGPQNRCHAFKDKFNNYLLRYIASMQS